MAGITKWFWVTPEGYLSYLLPKFEALVPTNSGSGAIETSWKCVSVTADFCTTKSVALLNEELDNPEQSLQLAQEVMA